VSGVTFFLRTPAASPGAVGIIELRAPDSAELERVFAAIGMGPVDVGSVSLASLCGIDQGLVARLDDETALLFPHGSPAVLRGIAEALQRIGLAERIGSEAKGGWLAALSAVRGRRGLELLLSQRKPTGRAESPEIAAARRRLFEPPTVLVWGRPNIGKSSLLNALAGRRLAITADAAGVTRDAVGAEVELDGIVVRWFDAAGIEADGGRESAGRLMASADLVLLCGDPNTPPPEIDVEGGPSIRVCLRSDLGEPAWECGLAATLRGPESAKSLEALARAVRQRLIPDEALDPAIAWRFGAAFG